MSHHFGEDAVTFDITPDEFSITIKQHFTGVPIMVSGPRTGIFENPNRKIAQREVQHLGEEIAHLLRRFLGENQNPTLPYPVSPAPL